MTTEGVRDSVNDRCRTMEAVAIRNTTLLNNDGGKIFLRSVGFGSCCIFQMKHGTQRIYHGFYLSPCTVSNVEVFFLNNVVCVTNNALSYRISDCTHNHRIQISCVHNLIYGMI